MQAQSDGLNTLLEDQAYHARQVTVFAGGWDLLQLLRVANSLIRPGLRLCLTDIDIAIEASLLSVFVPLRSFQEVVYCGSAPAKTFPPSVSKLILRDTYASFWFRHRSDPDYEAAASWARSQQHSQQVLRALQPLASLRVLELDHMCWCVTESDVRNLAAWLPELTRLKLKLAIWSGFKHELGCLSRLERVQLELALTWWQHEACGCLTATLQHLCQLRLHTLELRAHGRLTDADEQLLARCSIGTLVLRFPAETPARRLRLLPQGCRVEYRPVCG